MSEHDSNWRYVDHIVEEHDVLARARESALELGILPVSPAVGAQISVVMAASGAQSIIEIGTGTGVSGLYILRASPHSVLTTIDTEPEHLTHAKRSFIEAGISPTRTRLINGEALQVLPRMNENSYDAVFVDAVPSQVLEYVEHGLRLVKPGGSVLIPNVLRDGRVADPAQRDDVTSLYRFLTTEIASSPAIISALSPVGNGLLQLVTFRDEGR